MFWRMDACQVSDVNCIFDHTFQDVFQILYRCIEVEVHVIITLNLIPPNGTNFMNKDGLVSWIWNFGEGFSDAEKVIVLLLNNPAQICVRF